MSVKNKKKYTKDFKLQVCNMVLKDNIKPSSIAEKMDINLSLIYRWLDQLKLYGNDAFVGSGYQHADSRELRMLKKENEYLKLENDILKKAAAYLAAHPELK